MADGHPVADLARHSPVHVEDRVVLDVRIPSHDDGIEVTPQDRAMPGAPSLGDAHVTGEDRGRSDVDHGRRIPARVLKAFEPGRTAAAQSPLPF